MSHTTAKLLASINRRAFAPTGQITFSTDELLEVADEETRSTIMPNILSVREEFFVYHTDYTIVANQAAYDIPARAVGMIAREVHYINSSGNIADLTRMEPENIATTIASGGVPEAFYLKNNQIHLYRTPSTSTGTLRVYFFLRPGNLIESSSGATITAIDTDTNVVTVGSIISSWATGDIFDLIRNDGAHEYRDFDLTSTTVSGNDITFGSLPSTLQVGDFVAAQGKSQVVQLPPDYQPCLAQAVAAFILDNMNLPGSEKAYARLNRMLDSAQKLITPRVHGAHRLISPPDWI